MTVRRIGSFLACLIVLAGCDQQQTKKADAPTGPLPAVVYATASLKRIAPSTEFAGRTAAYREVDVRAQVEGTLIERPFVEGSIVEKGQTLFVIDPAPFKADLAARKAELERNRATLLAANAQFERAKVLVKKGDISKSKFDEQEASASRAKADVGKAKADVEKASIKLGYTRITAPIKGRVSLTKYNVGNLIAPGSGTLTTIINLDKMYVTFDVADRLILNFMERKTINAAKKIVLKLLLSNGKAYRHSGEIDFLDNQVDATTGTVQLRGVFPNPDNLLLPNQFVTVTVAGKTAEDQLVIPQAAVQENQAGEFVLVIGENNAVSARQVKMGRRIGTEWVVTSGLKKGEKVIVEGLQKVKPGARVRPVPAKGQGASLGKSGRPASSNRN